MSYQFAHALQFVVYQTLLVHQPLTALVGTNIFDAVPTGTIAETYILVGEDKAVDRSDLTGQLARHDLTIQIVSSANGYSDAKRVAGAVCDALEAIQINLSTDNVRQVQFRSAHARRDTGAGERRIDLKYRALVDHR